jgi:hypothetical protein
MKTRLLVLCLFIARFLTFGAESLVVESGNGNSLNGFPFGISGAGTMRYQQVYSAALFSPISDGGGWITTIRLAYDPPRPEIGFITELQIDFSTTLRSPDSLSTVFAENLGTDNMVVLGPRTAGFAPTVLGSRLPIPLTLDQPFYYDPARGNLLMDVRVIRQDGPGLGTFDATLLEADSVSRIYAFDVGSLSGIADTLGIDTGFVITPVPEPAALALVAVGLAALSLWFRQHKRNTPKQKDKTWH